MAVKVAADNDLGIQALMFFSLLNNLSIKVYSCYGVSVLFLRSCCLFYSYTTIIRTGPVYVSIVGCRIVIQLYPNCLYFQLFVDLEHKSVPVPYISFFSVCSWCDCLLGLVSWCLGSVVIRLDMWLKYC